MEEAKMILVVDDNPTNLNVLFEYLEESGFEVSVASSAESAFEQLRHILPDLILLDVMMPGMDGFDACRKLKNEPATQDIPILFMTALTETVDKVKGFLAGGDDYITKPLQYEEVLARINAHLRIRALEKDVNASKAVLEKKDHELASLTARLNELETSKQTCFSYISSSLQTPVNSLLGFTRMILENLDHYSKEQIKNDILRLQHSAEQLYAQQENLILWAQFQRGDLPYTPRPLNLDELFIYNVVLFSSAAKQKQITIDSVVGENLTVYADEMLMNAILRNLLSNAIKFTETGGKIAVSSSETERAVEICFTDSGSGFSETQLKTLLADDTEEHHGLGVLLCKALAEKQGGTLRVTSSQGKGATFCITVPKGKHP